MGRDLQTNSDTIYSRLVNSTGVTNNKVISKVGTVWFSNVSNYVSLATSHDGREIAGARVGNLIPQNICYIFNFNPQTGKLADKVSTKIYGNPYLGTTPATLNMLEFSPDNKLLYRLYSVYNNYNGGCGGSYNALFLSNIIFVILIQLH